MQLINFHITSNNHQQYISISIKHQYNNTYIKIIEPNGIEHIFNDTHHNTIAFLSNLFQKIDKETYTNIQVVIPFAITQNINVLAPDYMQHINCVLHKYSRMVSSNGEIVIGNYHYRD